VAHGNNGSTTVAHRLMASIKLTHDISPLLFEQLVIKAVGRAITRTRLNPLKHDNDMVLSLLHFGLVFYFPLGINEARVL
jgi:hypothetical protein